MQSKPRSPSQIAKERREKKKYSFSLIKENVDAISKMAVSNKIPVSEIIDEAISFYLDHLKDQNGK